MRGFQLAVAIALWLAPASSAPAHARNYELDILHGFDVTHGEDYVLHEELDDELYTPGEPYVGSLPLECIDKCVADPHCHGFVTSEHVCFFRGDSRSTAELIAAKTPSPTCTLYLINRYHAFTQDVLKTLCLLFVGVIIATAIALFFRSRIGQSKARGEEGDGLVNGELSDGTIKGAGAAGLGEKKKSWWEEQLSWWDEPVFKARDVEGGIPESPSKGDLRVGIPGELGEKKPSWWDGVVDNTKKGLDAAGAAAAEKAAAAKAAALATRDGIGDKFNAAGAATGAAAKGARDGVVDKFGQLQTKAGETKENVSRSAAATRENLSASATASKDDFAANVAQIVGGASAARDGIYDQFGRLKSKAGEAGAAVGSAAGAASNATRDGIVGGYNAVADATIDGVVRVSNDVGGAAGAAAKATAGGAKVVGSAAGKAGNATRDGLVGGYNAVADATIDGVVAGSNATIGGAKVVGSAASKAGKATKDGVVVGANATSDALVIAANATGEATGKAAIATRDGLGWGAWAFGRSASAVGGAAGAAAKATKDGVVGGANAVSAAAGAAGSAASQQIAGGAKVVGAATRDGVVAGSKAVGGAAKELGGAAGAAGAATRDGLASGAYKMQQLGDSTEAGLKQAAANTGAKISETGAMLDDAQSNVGMPADSLIDKIGRSLRERSGSVGANGEPSTVWQGKQKASVPFQQKQPPTQKTKQADAAVPKATIVVEPSALAPAPAPAQLDKPAPLEKSESLVDRIGAKLWGSGGSAGANADPKAAPAAPARRATAPAPAPAPAQLGKPADSLARSNSTQAKAGTPADSLARSNSAQAKAGTPVDSLVDRLSAHLRGSGGSVGANGAPSTGLLGSRDGSRDQQAPPVTAPVTATIVPPVAAPAAAPVTKRASNTGLLGSAFPKGRKASQGITGEREVQRTANLHEVASGVARVVDKPVTAVSKAGRDLNNALDRVTDNPMDGGRV